MHESGKTSTSTPEFSANMTPIDEAIAFLQVSGKPSISEVARNFKVERFTFSKQKF